MTAQRRRKRCVCGRSKQMPLCDGAHKSAGWQCDPGGDSPIPVAFASSPSLRNLADRLAHRFQGQTIRTSAKKVTTERLVLVTDGHDTDRLQQVMADVTAEDVLVLGVGAAAPGVQWAFPNANFRAVEEGDDLSLWKRTEAALTEAGPPTSARPVPRLFLTHSVVDEARLFPVVECLREQYRLPVFVCADSIAPGSDWQAEIQRQLEQCDRVLFVASENANQSAFCAFEAGMATALGKAIHVVNLDGTRLPDFLQQIQAIDVPRLLNRKPWLTTEDALLEACLESAL